MQTKTDNSRRPIDVESRNTSSVWEQLLHSFKTGKQYRHAFVEEKVRTSVAAQIKAIREQHNLKQPEFAKTLQKSQSWVSRLEDANQPPPTISSLLKVAEAFDVDLEIRFGRFSELLDRLDQMTANSLEVPSFEEELLELEPSIAKKREQNRGLAAMPSTEDRQDAEQPLGRRSNVLQFCAPRKKPTSGSQALREYQYGQTAQAARG